MVEDVFLLSRTVVDNLFFLLCQFTEGDVRAHAHFPAHVRHQRPHEGIPGGNGPFVDGKGFIRHQRGPVNRPDNPGSVAGAAGTLTVKGQLFGRGSEEMFPAFRTDQFLTCCYSQSGLQIMSVRTSVAGKPGEHEPETVQKFSSGAEGAADAGHPGTLVKGQGGRHIQYLVNLCFCCLCHAPPCVGGKRVQITAGALGVQNAQGQRRFAGA